MVNRPTSAVTEHPHITAFAELLVPTAPAASLGYRLPAEWEPQAAVWVSPPTNTDTWPRCLNQAGRQFDAWIDQLRRFAPVCTPQSLGIPTDDSWIRDYGPIFVVREEAEAAETHGVPAPDAVTPSPTHPGLTGGQRGGRASLAMHDFHFNTWGGKYPMQTRDDVVPQHLARWLGVPIWVHSFVLEGGAIEPNGQGTLLTTEQCLLNPNRNPEYSRDYVETKLAETLGISNVIWLTGGITGDDTDGHVDDVARFINPNTVVAAVAPEGHPDHDMLARNLAVLREARLSNGLDLNVIELPVPEPMHYDFPENDPDRPGRRPLPASYANFLMCNGALFVPTFGQSSDDKALRILEAALPDYEVIPIRSEWLVIGLGAMHCMSMSQPMLRHPARL